MLIVPGKLVGMSPLLVLAKVGGLTPRFYAIAELKIWRKPHTG